MFFDNFNKFLKIASILIIVFYFVIHSVVGENGFISYISIKKNLKLQTDHLNILKVEKTWLENHVDLLGNATLDLDLLEERCRIVLNYAYDSDAIVREISPT